MVLHGSGWKSTLDGAGESHSWEVSHKRHSLNHLRRCQEKLLAFGHLYTEGNQVQEPDAGKLTYSTLACNPNTRTGRESLSSCSISLLPSTDKLNTCQLVKDKDLKCPNPFHRAGKRINLELSQ